jgi:trimethylamine---corrinoid protein Co-methyltransferase
MEANYTQNNTPRFEIFTRQQIQKIHYATLEILERTGVKIESQAALELLDGAGADISDPNRVKMPSHLVEQAVRSAPKNVILYTRDGDPYVRLNGNRTYFGATPDMREILDPKTRTSRNIMIKDIAAISRLIDASPNMSWIYTTGWGGYHEGIPGSLADRMAFSIAMRNTPKPVGACIQSVSNLKDMIDCAAIVVGGHKQLKRKPYFWAAVEPISPLVQCKDAVEKTMLCAEYGVPCVGYSMLMGGASAPASFAAILALANAETLSLLVIHQLKNAGSPYIYGAIPNTMDMKTSIFTYGAPEMSLLVAALTEMSHYYELPMWGTAGCTDAKGVGLQAGLEVMQQCMMTALSGANFIHDVGLIANGMQVSPELITLTDEVIDMVKIVMNGIEVTDESLTLDLIEKIGPGGNFLGDPHTFKNFRKFWQPTILDRTQVKQGAKTEDIVNCEDMLRQKTIDIMENHEPIPIAEDVMKEVRSFEKSWFEKLDIKYEYEE